MAKDKHKNVEGTSQDAQNSRYKLSLFDIFSYYRKYWYWFVISVAVICGLGMVYSKLKPPTYEIDANIRISQDESSGLLSLAGFTDLFGGGNNVDDEVFVVQSHSVLCQVVRSDSLFVSHYVDNGILRKAMAYKDYPVGIDIPKGIEDTLRRTLTFKIKTDGKRMEDVVVRAGKDKILTAEDLPFPGTVETDYGTFSFYPTEYYPAEDGVKTIITLSGVDAKAEELSSQVEISVANRQSNVISLAIKSPSIAYGKAVINGIIEQYNARAVSDKNAQAGQTLSFIENRLAMISDALATSEDEVAEYKTNNNIVDLMADTQYNYAQRGEIEKNLVQAGSQLEVLAMTRDFLRVPENAHSLIPTTVEMAALQSMLTEYNTAILKRIELASAAKTGNANLRLIDEQLDAMRKNILTSIDRTYSDQQVVYNNLKRQADESASRLGGVPRIERQFRDIIRQQEIKEHLYVFLLQRREETAMMMANALPKGIIIDQAYALNEPVNLSTKMMLIFCFLLGLLIPGVLLYIKLLLRTKFALREELERLTDAPILGEVCQTRRPERLVVFPGGSSSIAELFRLIRTNLQFVLGSNESNTILVTSTRSGEGKSFVAINLAASIALTGKRVLLVGLDVRKPMLESYLNMMPGRGLTEYLSSDQVKIDDIIRRAPLEQSSMDIITAGPVPPNPGEMLLSERLDELFAKLSEMYDVIIIDSAPVGMVSDTFVLSRLADATIYVCRSSYTRISDINFANKVYDEKRLPKMSLVLNGTPVRKGYGYGYGQQDKD